MALRTLISAAIAIGFAGPALAIGDKLAVEMRGADGKAIGQIELIESTAGILLKVKLAGLPPGPHGFHFHDRGECTGDFASAGEIYNPLGSKHGFLNDEGPMAGDLPNLFVTATGEVEVELITPFVNLSRTAEETIFDTDGTSLVIYAQADDYQSEPDGNAGARIACGVVSAPK
jgi:Cu-Zn family superoxide dismutase